MCSPFNFKVCVWKIIWLFDKKSKDFSTSKKKKYNNKNIMEFSSKPRTFCLFLAMLLSTVQSLPSASPVQTTTSKKSSNQCGVRSWGAPLNNATQLSNFDEDHFRAYPDSFPWVVQLGLSSPQTNSDRWSNWEICFWQLSIYCIYLYYTQGYGVSSPGMQN